MADEYIRKADAIGAIWHSIDGELFGELESCAHAVIGDANNAIESLKPADVVPVVHGRWKKIGEWGRVYRCNQCGNFLDFDGVNAGRGDANFCPNCGARMDGGKED